MTPNCIEETMAYTHHQFSESPDLPTFLFLNKDWVIACLASISLIILFAIIVAKAEEYERRMSYPKPRFSDHLDSEITFSSHLYDEVSPHESSN